MFINVPACVWTKFLPYPSLCPRHFWSKWRDILYSRHLKFFQGKWTLPRRWGVKSIISNLIPFLRGRGHNFYLGWIVISIVSNLKWYILPTHSNSPFLKCYFPLRTRQFAYFPPLLKMSLLKLNWPFCVLLVVIVVCRQLLLTAVLITET